MLFPFALLDLYIKLLKQVAKYLNYVSYHYHKHSKWKRISARNSQLYCLFFGIQIFIRRKPAVHK